MADSVRRAGILVTGSEVIGGRTLDRNSGHLVQQLERFGVRTDYTIVVGDDPETMRRGLAFLAAEGVDLICTTGGLGPTHDDLSMQIVAEVTGRAMVLDEAVRARIDEIIRGFGRRLGVTPEAMDAGTRKQATLPEGVVALPPQGTAPGALVPARDGFPLVCVLPGPPRELAPMFAEATATEPLASLIGGGAGYGTRSMRFFGVPESVVARHFDAVADEVRAAGGDPDAIDVTICARFAEVEVFLRYRPEQAVAADDWAHRLAEREPDALFSPDGQTVDQVIGEALVARGETVATAESCTAGLVAARLTQRAGSSAWFVGGAVTYADRAKTRLVGVDPAVLASVGAVSDEVAGAMAEGARAALGADWAVSTTGIAGPGGGTADKPVGLVYLAVAGPGGRLRVDHRRFPGTREDVRERATSAVLHLLRVELAEAA